MTEITTALGRIPTEGLGAVLAHEHLFLNMLRERRGDGLLNDETLISSELAVFADQGGHAIFDLTAAELTHGSVPEAVPAADRNVRAAANVRAVQRVSKATGIHVVLGTGHYRDPYLDRSWFDHHDVDAIAEGIVRDLDEGFPGTDAKAGIIGEIGADAWYISAAEERSFRAAARAAGRTGAAIYTHAARWPVGLAQLDLLAEERMDPSRVAVGHCDTVPLDGYALEVARRGAYVGLDTINTSSPTVVNRTVGLVMKLVHAGHIDQVLLSHDVCLTSQLKANGGNGFSFVLAGLRSALLDAGLAPEQFDHITTVNPVRLITG